MNISVSKKVVNFSVSKSLKHKNIKSHTGKNGLANVCDKQRCLTIFDSGKNKDELNAWPNAIITRERRKLKTLEICEKGIQSWTRAFFFFFFFCLNVIETN